MVRTSKFTDTSGACVVRVTELNKWHIYDMISKWSRLILITITLYTLSAKRMLIFVVLYVRHSLLYISFSCGYRTVCYLEEVSLGTKVLSEETGFVDVNVLKKSHTTSLFLVERIQSYMFTENNNSLCLQRTAV